MAAWVFIYIAFVEFTFFFAVFLVAKAHNTQAFHDGPAHLNTYAGMINTLVMITSSYFIAIAIRAIKNNEKGKCLLFFYLTLLCGLTYCGIKLWEYQWNGSMGITVRKDIFYSAYYYLTFNHLLHVLTGIGVMTIMIVSQHLKIYDADNHEGLESAASYWHMIDLVWIIIFPLVYILGGR